MTTEENFLKMKQFVNCFILNENKKTLTSMHGEGFSWHRCPEPGYEQKYKWKRTLTRHRAAHEAVTYPCPLGCGYRSVFFLLFVKQRFFYLQKKIAPFGRDFYPKTVDLDQKLL